MWGETLSNSPICLWPKLLVGQFTYICHCLRRLDTQRIDLSAKTHHDWKVGFVSIRSMLYSTHYVTKTYLVTFPTWSGQKAVSMTRDDADCMSHAPTMLKSDRCQYAIVMPPIWDIVTFVGSWLQLEVYFNLFAHTERESWKLSAFTISRSNCHSHETIRYLI